MEQETLFTSAKWDMLRALANSSKSPIELAEQSNTSVSNISQSLRFLELAGIVKSERIGNRDKGQPRIVYSLTGSRAFIIVASNHFVDKKLIFLDDYKKMLIRIWFYENESLHGFIERALNEIEDILPSLKGVFLDTNSSSEIRLVLVHKDKGFKKELKETSITWQGASRKAKFSFLEEAAVSKSKSQYYAIHDPQKIIGGSNT